MLPEPFESLEAASKRVKGEIVIEIIENPDDILNAIKGGYNVERIKDGWMSLSRPTREQVEVEKDGYYERSS